MIARKNKYKHSNMKRNMKMTKTILCGAAVAAFITNQTVGADNLAAAAAVASASVHRLVVASPHGLEEFPWLLRSPSVQADARQKSEAVLAAIEKNKALAASPRVREQFPELARAGWSSTDVSLRPDSAFTPPAEVIKNRALVASPRVKEQYPALARGHTTEPAEKPLQVAPLK